MLRLKLNYVSKSGPLWVHPNCVFKAVKRIARKVFNNFNLTGFVLRLQNDFMYATNSVKYCTYTTFLKFYDAHIMF